MAHTDVRLTTRWEEDDLAMAFYSCLHEFGHGLYEAQMDPRTTGRRSPRPPALGVHESQSRLWENLVGRSQAVLRVGAAASCARHLGGPFDARDSRELYRNVNQVRLSLIRIEADETTYNLHIALRFELELALVEGRLGGQRPARGLGRGHAPAARPGDAATREGVLQDIHWGAGMIGYFPTYTIGNLMAAQLWSALRADLPDIDEQHRRGRLRPAARVAARATSTATAASTPARAAAPRHRARSCGWSRSWTI